MTWLGCPPKPAESLAESFPAAQVRAEQHLCQLVPGAPLAWVPQQPAKPCVQEFYLPHLGLSHL